MKDLNREQRRGLLGARAFGLQQKEKSGEKLTYQERNILNIALKKAKKRAKL